MEYAKAKTALEQNGYTTLDNLYTEEEVTHILNCLEATEEKGNSFSKTKDVFAIRQLIKNIPDLSALLFTKNLKSLLSELFKSECFLTKAIYFDKPRTSNWFVAYHQDLSISVNQRTEVENYKNWTFKQGQYGVQPPLHILENTITLRVHLDDTDKNNGALKVIPKSHHNGIVREPLDLEKKEYCELKKGGVQIMKPLTFHASNKTTNGKRRRVIHMEFNTLKLDEPLHWLEYHKLNTTS
ncbi:phytanoyl-CoA dioxygenase family protein [Spongiimicrobium salis]|uniref:phytanoyl-CoA dioxygenase family protein n=1 Tax=Spongiimicrobium salis TaxID=1667022 RepID=UPI00374CE002